MRGILRAKCNGKHTLIVHILKKAHADKRTCARPLTFYYDAYKLYGDAAAEGALTRTNSLRAGRRVHKSARKTKTKKTCAPSCSCSSIRGIRIARSALYAAINRACMHMYVCVCVSAI